MFEKALSRPQTADAYGRKLIIFSGLVNRRIRPRPAPGATSRRDSSRLRRYGCAAASSPRASESASADSRKSVSPARSGAAISRASPRRIRHWCGCGQARARHSAQSACGGHGSRARAPRRFPRRPRQPRSAADTAGTSICRSMRSSMGPRCGPDSARAALPGGRHSRAPRACATPRSVRVIAAVFSASSHPSRGCSDASSLVRKSDKSGEARASGPEPDLEVYAAFLRSAARLDAFDSAVVTTRRTPARNPRPRSLHSKPKAPRPGQERIMRTSTLRRRVEPRA